MVSRCVVYGVLLVFFIIIVLLVIRVVVVGLLVSVSGKLNGVIIIYMLYGCMMLVLCEMMLLIGLFGSVWW